MAKQPLTPEQIAQLKQDLIKIQELAIKLNRTDIDIAGFSSLEKSAGLIKTTLQQLKDEYAEVTSGASAAASGFRNVVKELSKQSTGVKDTIRSYKGLTSIADQLQSYYRGWRDLSEKDITRLREKMLLERVRIEEINKTLKTEETASENQLQFLDQRIAKLTKLIQTDKSNAKEHKENLKKVEKAREDERNNLNSIKDAIAQNNALIADEDELFKSLNLTLHETLRQIKKDFVEDLDKSFKNIVEEVQNTDTSIKKTAKVFNTLTTLAQKIQDHQSDINKLNEKDIKVITQKLEAERKRLESYQLLLQQERKSLETSLATQEIRKKTLNEELTLQEQQLSNLTEQDANYSITLKRVEDLKKELLDINEIQNNTLNDISTNEIANKKITETLDKQNGTYEKIREKLERIKSEQEQIRKTLGLSGVAVDGLEQALNKIGFGGLAKAMGIEDARDQMRTLAEEIVKNQQEEINLRKKVEETKQELASKGYDQVLTKLNREKQLEEEIAKNRGKFTDAQIKSRFGGTLKNQVLELEALKATITEKDRELHQQAEINKLDEEHVNSLNKQNAQYNGIGGQLAVLKKGVQTLGSNLTKHLKDPLSLAIALIGQMTLALAESDKAIGELAKGANMTYDAAASLRQEFSRIANLSMDSAVSTKTIQESYLAMENSVGAQVDMNAANLELMTKLRERAGVTNETYASMAKYASATGQEVEGTISGFLGGAKALGLQANKMINVKELLAETSKTSNAIKLSISGGAEALGRAAAQAKMLGMTLNQVDRIAGSLLQFEDSISSELSAELLTGKELNLETARYAALTGNVEVLSKEIAKNIGSAADFTNMNRIQQEALAKAVGMTREELADTLVEQEAFSKLGRDLTAEEKAAYEFAKEKYGLQKAAKMVGEGELDDLMKQQSVQDRFNQSVDKLKEIFVSLAGPILQIVSPIVDVLAPTLSAIGGILGEISRHFGGLLKLIMPVIVAYGTFLAISKSILAIQKAAIMAQGLYNLVAGKGLAIEQLRGLVIAKNFLKGIGEYAISAGASVAKIPYVGPILAVAAIAAAAAGGMALYSKFGGGDSVNDAIFDPKKGPLMVGEFGAVQLDPKDKAMYDAKGNIKVGTDLLGEKKMSKDKMIPSPNAANKTTNVTNNIVTKASSYNTDTSTTASLANVSSTTSDKIKEVNTQLNTNVNSQEASKEISKNALTVFKNISKEKEIANVAQNVLASKDVLSKEKEIINNIVKSISTTAAEEIAKETNVFRSPIEKTKEITFNNDKLKDTNVLNKTLSYIDKTSDLKTETLTTAANQLAFFDSTNKLKAKTLISNKQQSEQTKEQNNNFLSTTDKEKEFTTIIPSENPNLPESSLNIASNTDKTTSLTTNNSNIVNQASVNNTKLMRELAQSFQSLLEENKKQNIALKYIASKNSDVYMDSTKVGTTSNIGSTDIGR